jgi:hypothetical protein
MSSFFNPKYPYFGQTYNLPNENELEQSLGEVYYESSPNYHERMERERAKRFLSPTNVINPQLIAPINKKNKNNKTNHKQTNLQENVQRLSISRGLIPVQTPKLKKLPKQRGSVQFINNKKPEQKVSRELYPPTPQLTIFHTPQGVVNMRSESERYLSSLRKMYNSSEKKKTPAKQPPQLGKQKLRFNLEETHNPLFYYNFTNPQVQQLEQHELKKKQVKRTVSNMNNRQQNKNPKKKTKNEEDEEEVPTQYNSNSN